MIITVLKRYQDALLVTIAVIFLAIIIGFYVWGLSTLGERLDGATKVPRIENSSSEFNFELARRKLKERGLLPP